MSQVLPFCSEETLTILEANLGSMPTVTTLLNEGLDAKVRKVLQYKQGCQQKLDISSKRARMLLL